MMRSRSEGVRVRVSSGEGGRCRSLERVTATRGRKRGMCAGDVGSSLWATFSL